jgi:hypothetical protein
MNEHHFTLLMDQIDAAMAPITNSIAKGSATDYAQYREMCGKVQGLRTARTLIEDLSRVYMDNDDD